MISFFRKALKKFDLFDWQTRSLFDPNWYVKTNLDLDISIRSSFRHYMRSGWKDGRDPNPLFDVKWYKKTCPDVAAAGMEPLTHYVTHGWKEGRNPHPLFDVQHYLEANSDVDNVGMEPLRHYLKYGWRENRDVAVSDKNYYLQHTAKATATGPERLNRYLVKTSGEHGNPALLFDSQKFVATLAEDERNLRAPLVEYVMRNRLDSTLTQVEFDAEYYALLYPELNNLSGTELRTHFEKIGRVQGRISAPPRAHDISAAALPGNRKKKVLEADEGKPNYSRPLVISGFHRSGTSLTANLFSVAGLHLGSKLLGANASNPYGHYEDTDVVAFHDRVLKQSGSYWQTNSAFVPIIKDEDWRWLLNYGIRKSVFSTWGFKDPRNCLFLPEWAQVFPDMRVLYVFRPCVQCVHSLKRRAARDLMQQRVPQINQRFWAIDDLAIRMYLNYAKSALRFLDAFPGESCVISLDSLLHGRDIISEARDNWGYQLGVTSMADVYDSEVMSLSGPNELVFDRTLLPQIEEVEARFRQKETLGFTKAGIPIRTEVSEAAIQ